MRRSVTVLVATVLGSALATSGALGATTTKWDVVAGSTYKTKAAATSEVSKLKKKKLTGFKVVKSGKKFKVDKVYSTKKAANAELSKLKKDGFTGKVAKA
jgi:hypothetical protein